MVLCVVEMVFWMKKIKATDWIYVKYYSKQWIELIHIHIQLRWFKWSSFIITIKVFGPIVHWKQVNGYFSAFLQESISILFLYLRKICIKFYQFSFVCLHTPFDIKNNIQTEKRSDNTPTEIFDIRLDCSDCKMFGIVSLGSVNENDRCITMPCILFSWLNFMDC